jgi:hypothetical protein
MIKKFVVIGGGTAGWVMAHMLRSFTEEHTEISVLESSEIKTIGVGEGTSTFFWAFINRWCPYMNEDEFIRETNATFKLGTKFTDWTHKGSVYTTPNDNLGHVPQSNHYWPPDFDAMRAWAIANQRSTNPTVQELLIMNDKSPFVRGKSAGHSYHFQADKCIEYFQKKAKPGRINRIIGTVQDFDIAPNSNIVTKLKLSDGREIEADFIIDCTGFHRLIPKRLGVEFDSWKKWVLVDRAINFPIPVKHDEKLPAYTLSHALESGWLWRIPTYTRYGSGYIYSSEFITKDKAFEKLERDFGAIDYQLEVKFDSGALDKGWVGNVMFGGLCAGFIEPMEATSLHSTIVNLLVWLKDYYRPEMPLHGDVLQNRYNKYYWKPYWNSVRDWILLHYQGGRKDTEYWRAISEMELPDTLQSKLDMWKHRLPRVDDYNFAHEVWQHSLTIGVCQGLGIATPEIAKRELDYYDLHDFGKELWNEYNNMAAGVYIHSQDHKKLLDEIHARK